MLHKLSSQEYAQRFEQNIVDCGLQTIKIISRKRDYNWDEKFQFNPQVDNDTIGQLLWDGSVLLSRYIVTNSQYFKDKIVLEIGAGVGLSSLIAAQFATEVVCSDHNAISLELMKENFLLNSNILKTQNIKIVNFNWNLNTDILKNELQTSSTIQQFDFIIASEILYLTANVKPAFNVVTTFLKRKKDSKFVLIHEKRFSLLPGGEMEKEDSVLTFALEYSKQCKLLSREINLNDFSKQHQENVTCIEFYWNEEALE